MSIDYYYLRDYLSDLYILSTCYWVELDCTQSSIWCVFEFDRDLVGRL